MNLCNKKEVPRKLLLGAHMSIAGDISDALARGESIGCTTMQLFIKNNRQWFAKPLTDETIETFKRSAKQSTINPVVAHSSYLINLCSTDDIVAKKSIQALTDELQRCILLGIPYLVLHPGSYALPNKENGLNKIANALNEILEQTAGNTKILLENMAGQGNCVGHTFEQLAYIRKQIDNKKRIGICFDTCHAFAAGYEFNTVETYDRLWQHFDSIIGLQHLDVIHLNDSKKGLNSHVDRHEHIGKGKLGLEPFKLIMNDEKFFSIPKILETPKDSLDDDLQNLHALANLMLPQTQKQLIVKLPEIGKKIK